MNGTDGDEIAFDMTGSNNWLLFNDIPSFEKDLRLFAWLIGCGFLIMFLPSLVAYPEPIPGLFVLGLSSIFFLMGLYAPDERWNARSLRMTREGIIVHDYSSSTRKENVYKTIPFKEVKGIGFEKDKWGIFKFSIKLHGNDESVDISEYDDHERQLDFYGFIEALNDLHPDGPQPSDQEFIENHAELKLEKHDRHPNIRSRKTPLNSVFEIGMMYLGLSMLLFFPIIEGDDGSPFMIGFLFSSFFVCCMLSLIVIEALMNEAMRLLDVLEKRASLEGEKIEIPIPFVSRLCLNMRSSLPLHEIEEVRRHMVLRPHSHRALVKTVRGKTFLVPYDIFDRLLENPSFKKVGRRLVNRRARYDCDQPVASLSWRRIRTVVLLPVLISISLAVYQLISTLLL